jgi:hypothetical protein
MLLVNKLAIVFNTCGISGREAVQQYVNGINSIIDQDIEGCEIIISSCLNSAEAISYVQDNISRKVTFNLIKEKLPVNVTFNHSCLVARELFGEFGGYLYIDSGITLRTNKDISILYDLLQKGRHALVAAQTDTDGGYDRWFGVDKMLTDSDFEIPIGKTINLHCQIFSKDILDYYGYLFPDIYASFCSESVFTFLCSAIGKTFVLSKDVMVSHIHSMDGPSSGFDPREWMMNGGITYEHPFLVDSVVRIAKEGHEFGFGYEEVQDLVVHKPEKYDGLICNDPRLKDFIRDNQFVGNMGLLDYSQIDHEVLQ